MNAERYHDAECTLGPSDPMRENFVTNFRTASIGPVIASVMALVLPACATSHSALSSASPIEKAFVRAAPTWDLDHDGTVTCEEWRQYADGLFIAADRAGNGFISPAEFNSMSVQDRLFETADFAYFDANGDGRVSRTEFVDKPNPAFRLLDKDHDCRLTSEELRAAYGVADAAKAKGSGDGNRGKSRRASGA